MLPMLEDQDRLFINKLAFRVGEIHRGDGRCLPLSARSDQELHQACDRATRRSSGHRAWPCAVVNGRALAEPYVPARFSDERSQSEMTIPANEYFVMGDHRSISSDSRDFGPVERKLIYGKAAFVYWPMDQGRGRALSSKLRSLYYGCDAYFTIIEKVSGSRLAPPTRAPSISGCAISMAAFSGLTDPP